MNIALRKRRMKEIIGSIVFYLMICFVLLYFARKIDKNNNVKIFIWMLILTLTLVSGLRHQTVGIDTQGYVTLISPLRDGYLFKLNNISEQGFIALSYILVNVSAGYTLALVVYAFITNALIVLRLYDYKDRISFTWAVFIYYMLFYFATFNTIRQWLAMAIVFYGTRYIGSNLKSNIKFMMFVLLAVLMHTTAIFAVFFVPLYYFSFPSKNMNDQIKKCAMMILTLLVGIYVYITIVNKYSVYISSTIYGDVSWVNIVLALFVCGIILYDNNGKIIIRRKNRKIYYDRETNIKYESLAFLIGIVLTLMVFLTRYADRVGQFFLLFEIVFFSYYIKKARTRAITIIFVFLLCVYLRFTSFISSGYGEVPYIPFWS